MSRYVFLASLVLASACGGGGAVLTRQPGPARAATPAVDSLAAPWIVRGSERPRSQRVEITALLESRIDTSVRVDTIATRAWYDWAENPTAVPRRVVGSVRAFAVRSAADSLWRVLNALSLPMAFVAEVPSSGSAPELLSPKADGCDAQAAVAPGWRETWVSPPRNLSPGTTWRDSSEGPLCRDGIVLRSTTVREFVVEGAVLRQGALRVVVQRNTRSVVRGTGVQFGDSVRFEGEGRGRARLELLPEGAVIAAGEGTSELRLTMRGRRRTQELVQRSALVIAIP